ncbi:hypothetical protein [Brevundimonas nasdae]|jgi:hypothetical protein|nr:hypothetical protein [Brevundimonas nasdae]
MTLHHAHAPSALHRLSLTAALRKLAKGWLDASKAYVATQYRRPWAS